MEPRVHTPHNSRTAVVHIVLHDHTAAAIPPHYRGPRKQLPGMSYNRRIHHRRLYIRLFRQLANTKLPPQQGVLHFGDMPRRNHPRTLSVRVQGAADCARDRRIHAPGSMLRKRRRVRHSQARTLVHATHRQDRIVPPHRRQLYGNMDIKTDGDNRPDIGAAVARRAARVAVLHSRSSNVARFSRARDVRELPVPRP